MILPRVTTLSEGRCGRFQVVQVAVIQSCRFVTMSALSIMIFGLYNPGWRCAHTKHSVYDRTNTSAYSSANGNPDFINGIDFNDIEPKANEEVYNKVNEHRIDNTPEETMVYDYNGTCDIIASCDSIEFDPRSSTIISEFGLVCDGVWKSRLIVSVLNCGMLIGAFVWGQLGEKFGRKVSLYGGNFIVVVSCGLAVLSPSWEVYTFFMFFIGIGGVGVVPSSNILVMEFLNSKWRAIVASLPVSNGGFIFFAIVTYFLRNWKYVHLTCSFFCLITCVGFFWVPESLRWLMVHGKTKRVEKTVEKISKWNKIPLQSPEASPDLINEKKEEVDSKTYTYLDLFKTRDIRSFTLRLCLIWAISIITYEIIGYGIQSLPGDFYSNIIIASCIELPSILLVGPLANKLGRRRTGICFTCVNILCCAAIVLSLLAMEKTSTRDNLVTGLAILNKLSVLGMICLMIAYGAELIPTTVRSLAFGFFNIVTRITGMVGSYIIPKDDLTLIVCFAVLMALQVLATSIVFSLPETKDRPLKDEITMEVHVTDYRGKSSEDGITNEVHANETRGKSSEDGITKEVNVTESRGKSSEDGMNVETSSIQWQREGKD